MEQCTRFYILLRISTTSSFSQILFLGFVSFCVDPGLAVSVVFSPVVIVSVGFVSALVISLLVSFLSVTTDVILMPSSVPYVNLVVFGDVYGAVVAGGDVYGDDVYGAVLTGGGHVNIPTFLELQIGSVTKVHHSKIMQSSVSNLRKGQNKINIK